MSASKWAEITKKVTYKLRLAVSFCPEDKALWQYRPKEKMLHSWHIFNKYLIHNIKMYQKHFYMQCLIPETELLLDVLSTWRFEKVRGKLFLAVTSATY